MKKLIAILTIAIVLVGAVFADPKTSEAHHLTVQATVSEVVPQFQLKLGTAVTNTTPNDFDNAAVSYTADAKAVAGGSIDLSGSGTVAIQVIAYLANAAKSNREFTFTFSGGRFTTITRNGHAADGTQGNEYVDPVIGTDAEDSPVGFTVDGDGASDPSVDVAFLGTTCTAGNIVTATYTYTKSDAYDPGTYEADIVLTIAAK